jgi:hypothetical protein
VRPSPLSSHPTSQSHTEPATQLDHLLGPFFSELSDEAATQIAEFLVQLALCFESTYLSQIRRYQGTQSPLDYDPNQLELFDPF